MCCYHTVHACVKNARQDSNNSHNRAAAKERGRSCPSTTPTTHSRQSSPHKSPATEDKPKEKPLSPQSQMHSTLLGRMEEAEAAAVSRGCFGEVCATCEWRCITVAHYCTNSRVECSILGAAGKPQTATASRDSLKQPGNWAGRRRLALADLFDRRLGRERNQNADQGTSFAP